jgi:hypothetical protein
LFTSQLNVKNDAYLKTAYVYLLISLFCVLFGAVYELFSHEVYSFYMIYAFVFPLVGGVLLFLLMGMGKLFINSSAVSCNLYHAGIATLTIGSILTGIVEIYGTTNTLIRIYWMAGTFMILGSLLLCMAQKKRNA